MAHANTSARARGLHASLGKVEVARTSIEVWHVRWAADHPQYGWQALGQMLRVNRDDLKFYCENPHLLGKGRAPAPAPDAQSPAERRAPPRPRPIATSCRAGSLEHHVLLAIGSGCGLAFDIAGRVGCELSTAYATITKLSLKGFIHKPRRHEPAAITDAGEVELERLDALDAPGAGE